MSEGNGHPYSWSAIFNGYNSEFMNECPFPVIPAYLAQQKFPEDGLSHLGQVTHIWCDDKQVAIQVAKASKIQFVVDNLEDMLGEVDAVLLARDDAETHYQLALPFLQAGLPIFIDKPLALSKNEADKIWDTQLKLNQVFTCSSLRYANELILTVAELEELGTICHVEGTVMKKWQTYAIHTLEPVILQIPNRGQLQKVTPFQKGEIKQVLVEWTNVSGFFKTTGNVSSPLEIRFFGTKGNITKVFKDSFNAFKNSLEAFINSIEQPSYNISKAETLELVSIIEQGLN